MYFTCIEPRYMYNYYFIQNIKIALYVHGENLMPNQCMSMFRFTLG